MTGDNVVLLDGYRRKPEQTAAANCCCHATYVCYPHRIAEAARILRVDLAAARAEGRVSMGRFVGTVEAVLPALEDIVAECLPDEVTAQ